MGLQAISQVRFYVGKIKINQNHQRQTAAVHVVSIQVARPRNVNARLQVVSVGPSVGAKLTSARTGKLWILK